MLIDFNDVTFWKILKYRNGKQNPVATRDGAQEEEGHEERSRGFQDGTTMIYNTLIQCAYPNAWDIQ